MKTAGTQPAHRWMSGSGVDCECICNPCAGWDEAELYNSGITAGTQMDERERSRLRMHL
ncbi:MAG: hypothetical protein K2P27_09995 [Lachnospiraceae bacterium]|nr:hypothetical protein [Lachnospiraceae bacterium]